MTGHSLWDFGEVEGLYAHLGMCRDGITSSHCASHGNAATRDMGTKDGVRRYQGCGYQGWRMQERRIQVPEMKDAGTKDLGTKDGGCRKEGYMYQ